MRGQRRSDAEIAEILRRYPHEKTEDIAKDMRLSKSMVYNVASRHGAVKPKRERCDKCTRPHYSKGLCSLHYQRKYKKEVRVADLAKYHFEKGGRRAVRPAPPGWGYLEVTG